MNSQEKIAVDTNLEELLDTLEDCCDDFLAHLQDTGVIDLTELENVKIKSTSRLQLFYLIKKLKQKDDGWSVIVDYLKGNNRATMAKTLDKSVRICHHSLSSKSILTEFTVALVNYYRSPQFTNVSAIKGDYEHVKDVVIPLLIDDKLNIIINGKQIDPSSVLKTLFRSQSANLAIVKGAPGMGKTTLVKKIAYDWAVNHSVAAIQQYPRRNLLMSCGCLNNSEIVDTNGFSLVLAIPLRSVDKADQFDQLAIDYFCCRLHMDDIDKVDLLAQINQLGFKVLIILDGLDKYRFYHQADNPLKTIFAPPFRRMSNLSTSSEQPTITYKMLITSKPYVSDQINRDFFPLRYQLCPFSNAQLAKFVTICCKSNLGVAKVAEVFKLHSNSIAKVPSVITLMCYLVNNDIQLPSSLTCLYDSFLRLMGTKLEKPNETPTNQQWKESQLVRNLGKLAFRGCTRDKRFGEIVQLEFPDKDMRKCLISNESFNSGFLRYKLNFTQERLMAEFFHQSIQDWFAAQHCYQLMSEGCKDVRNLVVKMILAEDCLFGRFLFSICSVESKFSEMVEWLHICVSDVELMRFCDLAKLIGSVSHSVTDCCKDDQIRMGQSLHISLDSVEEKIVENWKRHWPISPLDYICDNFAFGLNLVPLWRNANEIPDFCICSNGQSNVAQLAVLGRGLKEGRLIGDFEQIQILFWQCWGYGQIEKMIELNSIPSVRMLILTMVTPMSLREVFFRLTYSNKCAPLALKYFRFGYGKFDQKDLFHLVDKFDMDIFSIDHIEQTRSVDGKPESQWEINLTINETVQQAILIGSLIKFALHTCTSVSVRRVSVAPSL